MKGFYSFAFSCDLKAPKEIDDNDDVKSSFKNRTSSQRAEVSLGSNLPSSFSVHILGGLDSNEMDCFRRHVSTLLS